ncbi:MAG: peptidyl-tRNA hydrolase Pth2 [Candidatus Micrarchaeota archaeon]|nr:peptidyl-tRNA hydrolase Pth2 [Candidatus Micrarchaeota archaeon]
MKQSIVLRTDLKMGKGKIAAQVAHASVLGYIAAAEKDKKLAKMWIEQGMPKIVLKVKDLNELLELYKKAQENNLICVLVKDAGKTQIEPNTLTTLAIGPAAAKEIDKLTKSLKLL